MLPENEPEPPVNDTNDRDTIGTTLVLPELSVICRSRL